VKSNTTAAEQPRDVSSLRLLLDEGWQVEPPVIARPRWGRERGALDYHFIAARGSRRTLVVLPDSAPVRQFCADAELVVALPAPERRGRRAAHKAPVEAS
jgi:hypothetical protein